MGRETHFLQRWRIASDDSEGAFLSIKDEVTLGRFLEGTLHSSEVIFGVVLPIMLFVVAGYIFRKLGKFDSGQSSTLIGYAMKVAIPSMIIVALANEPVQDYVP
ncbi:MAG: hypothetical protein VX641_06430 [Planctomycetota bacterium]|nr:hypothetical protein [Planctomycetota bacterium]